MSNTRRRGPPAILLGGWLVGCAGSWPPEEITPEHRAAAGCYELQAGPWLSAEGVRLDTTRWDAPTFELPPVVRLDARESRVPILGHLQVTPQPAPGSVYRWHLPIPAPHRLVIARHIECGSVVIPRDR